MDANSKKSISIIANHPNANRKSSTELPAQLTNAIAEIKQRYGNAQDFMVLFNKNIQSLTARYPEKAYLGKAPTLNLIRMAYSTKILAVWLMAQLEDINDFVGIRHKMNIDQLEQTALIIATEYHFLKASEIHLFLFRFKAGRYGHFYGTIDPLKVTQALTSFVSDRQAEIRRIEQKNKQSELEQLHQQWAKTSITRQQYEQLKLNKTNQYETR